MDGIQRAIVVALHRSRTGRLDLAELGAAVGVRPGRGSDPLASPLNRALVALRSAGVVRWVNEGSAFGDPVFELLDPAPVE